jgi:hypothetical protein
VGGGHDWATRSWAERAYWFPAFAVPAGAQAVQAMSAGNANRNANLSSWGGDDDTSHGYPAQRPLGRYLAHTSR